jgi:hypothetical protein
MRGFEIVAGVIAAFFAIGIGVGVLLVIALPALSRRRGTRDIGREDNYRRYGLPPGYGDDDRPGWQEPPGPDDDESPPPWPGRRG